MPDPLGTTIGWASMGPTMPLLSGIDCVADDLIVRLTTARLFYDSQFGYDLNALINAAIVSPQSVTQKMSAEIKKDQRVASVQTTATFVSETLTVTSNIVLVTGQAFSLVGLISTIDPAGFNFQYTVLAPSTVT